MDVRAVELPWRSVAEVIRLCRGASQPVVLVGEWAAGEVVIATDPLFVATSQEGVVGQHEPFSFLDRQPVVEGPSPQGSLGGGWFGWFGFESSYAFAFYPNVLRYAAGQWWDEALVGLVSDAELELRRRRLCGLISVPAQGAPYELGPVRANRGRSEHVAAVERCIQRIRAGEIYQANICLTLAADLEGSPTDLAADLLERLQPPYGAYLRLGETEDSAVASASPELFLRRDGARVTSTPIKGTRPRTPATAEAERVRLSGSQKDRAENIMIVDLVRNDLSRVADIGSVRVTRLLDVIEAPGVWHLVSSIQAAVPAGVSDGQLLCATFPPGSVSGAPKSRALDIIAELEGQPRGVYTGAIGYASPVAGLELSVAIRTVHLTKGRFSLGVGGGITVDSTPLQEWFECFDKARPLLRSVGGQVADTATFRPLRDDRAAAGIYDTSLLRFGVARDRAEHVARLERSFYELYDRPLPSAVADLLLRPVHSDQRWQRQRVDVTSAGLVSVITSAVAAPAPIGDAPGVRAVVFRADTGFGGHKWSDRREQEEREAGYPGCIVLLGDSEGLLEASRANVIAVRDGRLVTAPLDGRVLPGVTRTVVLDLAGDLGIDIDLRAPDPQEVSGLAIVNSVIGMRWVQQCGDIIWDDPGDVLGELSRRLVDRWSERATVAE